MKIVFCGPPHSGKSVFIANLSEKMPTDSYTILRACPDGEGTWSNNKNQVETGLVRKKGKFTKSFIDDACQAIDNQTNKIVFVDVGGIISEENEQVFKHCDSFIVLSNNEEKKKEWLDFGEKLGLECVGLFDSKLEGQEEIYEKEPYLKGRIVGLERGKKFQNSELINTLATNIIQKSNYAQKQQNSNEELDKILLDDTELGFALGYGRESQTGDGTSIKQVKWTEEAIPKVYRYIQEKVKAGEPVNINGVRANFILSAICKACKQNRVTDISTYDVRSKQYIPIRNIAKKRGINQAEGLQYNTIENKQNIFMDVDITKEQYTLDDFEKCVLPKIKEGKNLYLSGRMPLWLLASISSSYDSNRIFTFQPGKGFTCISSKDEKDLGIIVDGIEGIDINQYFKDKKERTEAKLPTLPQKQGFLAKIASRFDAIKQKSKYVNEAVKNKIISFCGTGKSTVENRWRVDKNLLGNGQTNKNVINKSKNENIYENNDEQK